VLLCSRMSAKLARLRPGDQIARHRAGARPSACWRETLIVTKEADCNMTVGRQRTGLKANLEVIGLFALLLSVVTSFLVGFLLREDSIGGASFDFYYFHWPLVKLFSAISWGQAIADYGGIAAANNPLLYMIASLLPFRDDQTSYHVITFIVALLTWPLLSWAYYHRYSKYRIDWLWASFGASTILISPSFRSSAFWGTTDYVPLVFCAVTSLLLSRFQDSEAGKARAVDLLTLIALAVVSSCAFYTRQFYAFLPIFAAWTVLTRTETPPFWVLSVFLVTMLPEMVLLYLWKGINPPPTQSDFHPATISVVLVGANVGLLSTPFILGSIRRSLADILPGWWGARSTVVTLAGLLVFIVALRATAWPALGGGIIEKAGLRMGALGTPFILTVSYFGLVAVVLFSIRSATNALLVGAFLVPFFTSLFSYQHYLEPALAVALFLFADTQTARTVFSKRVLTCNFVFSALILAIAIVYYDLFQHLSEIPK